MVGSTSAATAGSLAQYATFVVRGDTGGSTNAGLINLARGAGAASMSSGHSAGNISFSDNAGLEFGDIGIVADAAPSGSSTPGRFVLKTTASGATTPTERLRVDSSGRVTAFNGGSNQASEFDSGANQFVITNNGNCGLTIDSTSSTSGSIHFADGPSGTESYRGRIKYDHSADSMILYTGAIEALEIDSSQRVSIGGAAVSQTRTVNIGSNSEANLAIETHNDATSETANIRFYKSGNTAASPQIVEANDNIAQLLFYGHDGTDYANAAAGIKVAVDGTPGSNDMPGEIIFSTNSGTTSITERLRILSTGRVNITNASGTFANLGEGLTIRADSDSTSDTSGLHIMNNSLTGSSNAGILFRNYDNHAAYIRSLRTGGVAGRLVFGTNTGAGTPQSNISTKLSIESKSIKFQAFLEEQAETRSNDISNDANFDVVNGNILYYEGSANGGAAQTINIRGDSSTTYNSMTSTDFVASLTVIHQPNSSEYVNAITIDGNSQTVEWLGGSPPSSASSSAYEAIHITVIKLGNASYKVLASVNEYD
jgi:hypothetical protein